MCPSKKYLHQPEGYFYLILQLSNATMQQKGMDITVSFRASFFPMKSKRIFQEHVFRINSFYNIDRTLRAL